jgi:hypothetical protein
MERRLHSQNVLNAYLLEKLRFKEALALARHGRHAEALAEARKRLLKDPGGATLLALACVQARAAEAARGDAGLAERYAQDAVAALKEARDKGLFQGPFGADLVTQEKDLAVLEGRRDYQEFLAGLPSG